MQAFVATVSASNRVSEGGINETADEMKHSCDSHDVWKWEEARL